MAARKPKVRTLEAKVVAAIKAMDWLTPADGAMAELAISYARTIDESDDGNALYLGPHLRQALKDLGGSPAFRREMGLEEGTGGKLGKLRALNGGRSRAG